MSSWGRSSRSTRRKVTAIIVLTLAACAGYAGWVRSHPRTTPPAVAVASPNPNAPPPVENPEPSPPIIQTAQRPEPSSATASTPPSAPAPQHPLVLTAIANRPPPDPRDAILDPVLRRANDFVLKGDVAGARDVLMSTRALSISQPVERALRDQLIRLADTTIFSPRIIPGDPLVEPYVAERGDNLVSIARRFRITDDLLMTINDLPGRHHLAAGTTLKVVHGPFNVRVTKSLYRLDVLLSDVLVRSYSVGLGANGSTATGRWIIRDKLSNPGWTDPRTNEKYAPDDPDNPIGEYWIGLEGVAGNAMGRRGFGIHGTIDPSSIGQQRSLGCVRLAPADIESLYQLLVSGVSEVEIAD